MTRYLISVGRPGQFRVCIIFLLRGPEVIVTRLSVQVSRELPLKPLEEARDGVRQRRVRGPDELTHSEKWNNDEMRILRKLRRRHFYEKKTIRA